MIVVVRLKSGDYIMGNLTITHESSIELKDALIVEVGRATGGFAVYFYKYCPFNQSFDISLQKAEITNIFDDPIPSLVDYYKAQAKMIKKTYNLKLEEDEHEDELPDDPAYEAFFEKLEKDPEVH